MTTKLTSKLPGETVIITFDFSAITISPSEPVFTIARESGAADPSPAAMLVGVASLSGPRVMQAIKGGVAGCTYRLSAQVSAPGGAVYIEQALLPVEATR